MKDIGQKRLLEILHEMELRLTAAAVDELIRLLGSTHFDALTSHQIYRIGQYDEIEIEGERYFERAFSPGKESASSLALAQMIGRDAALADLIELRASLAEAA